MSLVAVIDIAGEEATVVTGEISVRGELSVLGVERILLPLPAPSEGGSKESSAEDLSRHGESGGGVVQALDSEGGAAASADLGGAGSIFGEIRSRLGEIQYSLAIVPSHRVLFQKLALPFSDPKKLEQVVPLQLQDVLPFEVDDFVVAITPLEREGAGGKEVLASIVAASDVERSLSALTPLGLDPRVLTTRSAALIELRRLAPEEFEGTFALLSESGRHLSLVIFVEGKPVMLQEFARVPAELASQRSVVLTALASAERELGCEVGRILAVGCDYELLRALVQVGLTVSELDLDSRVHRGERFEGSINEIAWAVGLLAAEESTSFFVNFRRGRFAYRARYDKLMEPLKEEVNYLFFALGAAILFLASLFYQGGKTASVLDERFERLVREVAPGQSVPSGRELAFIQGRLDEIETQLRAMGSLASLSPLGALKEVAETVPSGTELDSVSVVNSRITLTGSVSDIPAVGRLEGVFKRKADRFCSVELQSKGKSGGSSRVPFVADIGLCE